MGVGSPKGAVHMAAASLGCKRAMAGTGLTNSYPGYMNEPRKHYSHPLGGFISGMEGSLESELVLANQES